MKFGWCSAGQSPSSHRSCKYQYIPTMGLHRDLLVVCECECHKDREPDFSGLPEGTLLATPETKRKPHQGFN